MRSLSALVGVLMLLPVSASAQMVFEGGNFGSLADAFDMSSREAAANFTVAQNATITGGRIFTSYQGGAGCTTTCDPNYGFRGQFNWALYSSDPSNLTPGTLLQSGSVIPVKTSLSVPESDFEKQRWDFALPNLHVTAGTSYWLSILNTDGTGSYAFAPMFWGGAGTRPSPYSPSAFREENGQWVALQEDGTLHSQFQNRLALELFGTFDKITTTPEPTSFALLGTGLIGFIPIVRRRKSVRS